MNARTAPANLRQRQRESRRRRFVAIAERLFLQHGYAGTSVNAIVRKAGGSLATLYAEFGTKERLFEAVISGRVRTVFAAEARTRAGTNDVRQQLLDLARIVHARILSPTSLALYRIAVAEGSRLPVVRDAVLDLGLAPFLEHLGGLFAQLDACGHLHVPDPPLAASRFLALVHGQHQFIAACGGAQRISAAERERHVVQAIEAFLVLHAAVPAVVRVAGRSRKVAH